MIVNDDADVAYAAERVAWGGFTYAGQTCISVQRVYVHGASTTHFVERAVRRVEALKVGDPLDEATDVGPLIDRGAAERVEEWLDEARRRGRDGPRRRRRATATSGSRPCSTACARTCASRCEEVVRAGRRRSNRFDDVHEAIDAAGRSEFGLQAGIFTNDLRVIDDAFDRIDVGGLMVNDVSTFRIDHMPYGGVKSLRLRARGAPLRDRGDDAS